MSYGGLGGTLHSEFGLNQTEETNLGVRTTSDYALVRSNGDLGSIVRYHLKNKGSGNATVTLKVRGKEFPISAENINALRVGVTNQFVGKFSNRRVKPNSVVIIDDNATTIQKVQDDGNGKLFQVDGPVGPSYPVEVGTIDYNEGVIDFTFALAVTLPVLADFVHTNWQAFGTPITHVIAAGGGGRTVVIKPDSATNFFNSIKGHTEIGWFGKLNATTQPETTIGLVVEYQDQEDMTLPLLKGEINDYPYHNG